MSFRQGAMGTRDLLERLKGPQAFELYREAKKARRSLSYHLERESPTDPSDKSGLDAFSRLLMEADVVTRSIPEEGIYASTGQELIKKCGRVMVLEWAWRRYRSAQATNREVWRAKNEGRALGSSDFPVGTIMRPYFDDTTPVVDGFQPAIPVSEVLAGTRPIDGNSFRGLYVKPIPAGEKRFVRIGERTPIPKVTVDLGERTIDMFKFGRGVEFSYEVLRRETLDRLGLIIDELAVQAEVDKLSAIVDTMVNGDGNTSTAATSFALVELDPTADANDPTVKAWYAFRGKWKNPYAMTHLLAQEGPSLSLQLLNTGTANLPLNVLPAGLGLGPALSPINRNLSSTIRFGETDDAPAGKWLGFDRRASVERMTEIGSDIEESERFASNQTEVVWFTEVEGYRVVNHNGVKIADLTDITP